jgi:tetratricopeptide (TPR) repeat protein
VPAVRPAEIDLTDFHTVAVGELHGRADPALVERVEEALIATNRFQVIDQKRTLSTMQELQLSFADLSNPAQAAKLGKVFGGSALIYGDADENYREGFSEERIKEKDSATVVQKIYGEMTVRATFRVVDVATGQLVVTRTYEERRTDLSRANERRPDPINKNQLLRSARAAVVERFLKALVPYQEFVTADFRKDSDLPQMEAGIGLAEQGEWKKAQDTFSAAAAQLEKSKDPDRKKLAKAYWNLGLAYEYGGDYEKAAQTVRKAYELSQDKSMLRELDGIDRLREESHRAAATRAAPEVASGK